MPNLVVCLTILRFALFEPRDPATIQLPREVSLIVSCQVYPYNFFMNTISFDCCNPSTISHRQTLHVETPYGWPDQSCISTASFPKRSIQSLAYNILASVLGTSLPQLVSGQGWFSLLRASVSRPLVWLFSVLDFLFCLKWIRARVNLLLTQRQKKIVLELLRRWILKLVVYQAEYFHTYIIKFGSSQSGLRMLPPSVSYWEFVRYIFFQKFWIF